VNQDLADRPPSIHVAANKHLVIDFNSYDSALYRQACHTLEQTFGFIQNGDTVTGLDEGIGPSFHRADVEISTGWDNWSGNYLLSNSSEGDDILQLLFARLSP